MFYVKGNDMTKLKKYISIFLCACLVITGIGINSTMLNVYASETPTHTGTVNVNDNLSVRAGPGVDYERIGNINPGVTVTIYGDAVEGGKYNWYKILYKNRFGYVASNYIVNVTPINIPSYDYDDDFETNLTRQNFPESYKVLLRQLHAQHPNWVFLADHLAMTFEEAVDNESVVGKSLVQDKTSLIPDSWKSMANTAYHWESGTYVSYDSGGWVTAEREVVEYYMEPRNFLNSNDIYMFIEQSYNPDIQTKEGLQLILNGTFMAGDFPEDTYDTYNDVIMEAAKQWGVSPYVLAASIIIEQGVNGKGGCILGTVSGYEGYYNYFNIRAYASGGYDAVTRGLMFAKDSGWNTRAKSIIDGAKHYANGYVKRGQDTLYYKKFNVIVPTYYINQYMTNVQAAYSEASKLRSAYASVDPNAALTFSIPVFKDTSSTNTTYLPTSSGANNYYLNSLSVNGVEIEGFNRYTNDYEIYVDGDSSVNISATTPSGASVSGTGNITLNSGSNSIVLTVTAASGKKANYNLSIFYSGNSAGGGTQVVPEPSVDTGYTMGSYVRGVSIGTSVAEFKNAFKVSNGSAKVLNSSGKEKTSGVICTGDKIAVYDNSGTHRYSYSIVIFGDTNSDGKVSIVDLARVQKHLLELSSLGGFQNTAADVNHDGKISILDLARVQKHLLELTKITQ